MALRIDKWVTENYDNLTRSYVQNLIENGMITVNGKTVKANYKVNDGDDVEVNIPELVEPDIVAEDIPLDIVYEDDDVIIINKPKDMVVHPAPGHYTGTVVNALMFHCGDSLSGINGVMRPGIVHRIDKDTTGLIVACKNNISHESLSEQLKEHSITRIYTAIVHGKFREKEGTVNAPIGRHRQDRKKMAIDAMNGREAITHYRVIEEFDEYSLVECRLETGRTHQIRVHMKSINHPVLCDEVYGPSKCPVKGLQGQCLHAGVLGFKHPTSGEYIEFSSELPDYMKKLIERFRQ